MSPEEIEAWLWEHPFIIAYICFLLGGSLVSFITIVVKINKAKRLGRYPVTAWPLSNLDFGLFIVALILWFVLSGAILIHLHSFVTGGESLPGPELTVLGGMLMQMGMLYLFYRFRFHYRSANEGPLSPRILSIWQSMLQGLYFFLASLPVVYAVGVAWNAVLEILRDRGFPVDLPLQDAVLLFQQTDSPVAFFGLLFLAVVVAPVVEENVFRGGVYRFLKGKATIPAALLVSGIMFGLIHGNLQSLPGLVTVGICLGLAYEISGSLRVPIFFHAFFNLNSILWILLIPDGMVG